MILPQALLSSGPSSGQFEVDLVYPIRGDGPVEPIENRQPSPRRDLLGQFGVGDQALDRGRQRHGLGWRDEQPVLAIDDRLDDSAGSRRDYRVLSSANDRGCDIREARSEHPHCVHNLLDALLLDHPADKNEQRARSRR